MKISFAPIARLLVTLYAFFPVVGVPIWINWLELDEELPEVIASHWGFDGTPDGFMRPADFAIAIAIVFAVLWFLTTWLLWTRRLPQLTRWVVVLPLVLVYLGLLNLTIELILLQRGLTDVTQVQLPASPLIFLFASIPLILGFALSMPKVVVIDGRIDASIWAIPVYRIQLTEIASIEVVELRARNFGGLGMRFGRHEFAIIPRPGTGVRIISIDKSIVSIRCKNAAEIVQAVTDRES